MKPAQLCLPFSLPPVRVTVRPSRADKVLAKAMHPRRPAPLLKVNGGLVLGLQQKGAK